MKRNISRKAEEAYLAETLRVVRDNVREYGQEVAKMQEDIDEMLEHYHDNDADPMPNIMSSRQRNSGTTLSRFQSTAGTICRMDWITYIAGTFSLPQSPT